MLPTETKIPLKVYVMLVLLLAIIGCVGAVLSGVGSSTIEVWFKSTPNSVSESSNNSSTNTPVSETQGTVSALETQVALQETLIVQQNQLLQATDTKDSASTTETHPITNTPTPLPATVSGTPNCAIATPLPHRVPVVGEPWILPSGGWIHLNFWSNEPGIDQTEHKILLGPDDPRTFMGGGSAWQFPDGCENSARANYDLVPHPEISLEELRSQNLVR